MEEGSGRSVEMKKPVSIENKPGRQGIANLKENLKRKSKEGESKIGNVSGRHHIPILNYVSTYVQKYTSGYEKIVVNSMCKYGIGEWRHRYADGEAREHWRTKPADKHCEFRQ